MVNNQCMGIYGKCLNIKITNACPGSCYFCIERNGYQPEHISVDELIQKANALEEYQTVLILGGEPFLYPHLVKLVNGLKKKEIYITTNGACFDRVNITELCKNLTGINISIHSYLEEENESFIHTKIDYSKMKKYIELFQKNGVPVRFNTILLSGGIDNKEKMLKMIDFCKEMKIDWIRFSELQFESRGFVAASDVFDTIHKDPYQEGCNQDFVINDIKITVRQSCGIASLMKEFPSLGLKRENKADSLVMYPNGEIYNGWIVPKNYKIRETDPCEKVIEK